MYEDVESREMWGEDAAVEIINRVSTTGAARVKRSSDVCLLPIQTGAQKSILACNIRQKSHFFNSPLCQ